MGVRDEDTEGVREEGEGKGCEGLREEKRRMELRGLVTWRLTDAGREACQVGLRLCNPESLAFSPCQRPLHEQSVWDLILRLDAEGWEHHAKRPKEVREPFQPGGQKIWYTRPNAVAVSRLYLQCRAPRWCQLARAMFPFRGWDRAAL